MKTYMANPDKIERKWYVVDAEGCTLGRLSSEIAKVLRGKNKPENGSRYGISEGYGFLRREYIFCKRIWQRITERPYGIGNVYPE